MKHLHAEISHDPETGEPSVLLFLEGKLLTSFYLEDEGYGRASLEDGSDFVSFINNANEATMKERNRAAMILNNYRRANLYISNEHSTDISKACDDMLKRLRDGKPEEETI